MRSLVMWFVSSESESSSIESSSLSLSKSAWSWISLLLGGEADSCSWKPPGEFWIWKDDAGAIWKHKREVIANYLLCSDSPLLDGKVKKGEKICWPLLPFPNSILDLSKRKDGTKTSSLPVQTKPKLSKKVLHFSFFSSIVYPSSEPYRDICRDSAKGHRTFVVIGKSVWFFRTFSNLVCWLL